jgi:hypothetical protein
MTLYSQQPIKSGTMGSKLGGAFPNTNPLNRGTIGPKPSPRQPGDKRLTPVPPKPKGIGAMPNKPGLPLPRRVTPPTLPVGNTGPFKPGTPGTSTSPITRSPSNNDRKAKDFAAKASRQERMMKKLKDSKGKVDRKQKDRFRRAAEFRMSKKH